MLQYESAYSGSHPYELASGEMLSLLFSPVAPYGLVYADLYPAKRDGTKRRLFSHNVRAASRSVGQIDPCQVSEALAREQWGPPDYAIRNVLPVYVMANGDEVSFLPNRDGPGSRSAGDRIITAVYYFHAEPKAFEGGELRLHALAASADGSARHADLPPRRNSLLIFPSWAPHEVLPVRCPSGAFRDSRFAINCWFRRARVD